eukprot:11363852-Ditylum_brightwellii.AAC.1
MWAKLESDKDYKEAASESDVIKLLKSQQYPYCAVHQAMQALYFTSQKEGMTLEQYLDEFTNRRE